MQRESSWSGWRKGIAGTAGAILLLAGAWAIGSGPASVGPVAARAAEAEGALEPMIRVQGEAREKVAPDMATVQIGVETQAKTAAEAMNGNAKRADAVIKALVDGGVKREEIQSSGLNLNPQWYYPDPPRPASEAKAPEVVGYQASQTLTVQVRDLGKLGNLVDRAVQAGATQIYNLQYDRSDAEARVRALLAKAVADARGKAEDLAKAAGTRVTAVVQIVEQGSSTTLPGGGFHFKRAAQEALAAAVPTPVEPGQMELGATVLVTFRHQ